MGLTLTYDSPFYTGGGSSSLVPAVFPIALNGRPYLLDTQSQDFQRGTIPLVRNQADTANIPGEQTINPEDLWRRAQDNWTHGAGQLYLDRIDPDVQTFHSNRGSDNTRYHSSKRINPWNRWYLSNHQTTTTIATTANTNLSIVSVGTYWYYSDGNTLRFKTDLSVGAGTAVTGTPASAITSIASDGYNVWIAYGANGIYTTTRGAAAATQLVTTAVDANTVVGYANGRLLVGYKNAIYNVTNLVGPAALPAALMTQANTDWLWTGFTDGPGYIYASGWSGDKSLIYKIGLTNDATALTAPIVAAPLPDGETARSIQGYLGYICLGTDKGVRFAAPDSSGNLTIGSLIPTPAPVYAFEPQDRFVWFTWTNYDSTSSGLGRLDLTQFTASLTPAFASDLMVDVQATVSSVATFSNKRVFAISGTGIYCESASVEATGTIDTGLMTFGLPDPKIGLYADLRHQALPTGSSVQVWIAVDNGAFSLVGNNNVVGTTGFTVALNQLVGELFEVRLVLNRATDTTLSPTVTRLTVRAYPAPNRNETAVVPILLYDSEERYSGVFTVNPLTELLAIQSMIRNHRMVVYQEGSLSQSVFVDEYEWHPDIDNPTKDGTWFNGTCVVKLKIISS